MSNAVLDRFIADRQAQVDTMDQILGQVVDRDLVDAERGILAACRDRIAALDEQIRPLQEFESLRAAHTASTSGLPIPSPRPSGLPAEPRRMDGGDRVPEYRSVGEFLVDLVRGHALMGGEADREAAHRVELINRRAVADQKTGDVPGILPTPIVGQVVSLLDSNRPLITSLGGAKGLGGIPGTTFTRPKVTQHTTVGVQAGGEKTQLPSQKMTVGSISFAKTTYGGTVDISRQSMDWTSPAAWDILIRDLAAVYSQQTEAAVAADFATKATGIKPPALPATPVLADWSKALYTAGMHSYQAGQRMPNRIWCSLDVWAALGALVDTTRVVLPVDTTREMGAPGTSELASFSGDLFGIPRVVAPLLPAKTCIVGPADLYEAYEEVIGLLSVIEPSILGVQVAYGGYLAFGSLAVGAFVALDLSAVTGLPTMADPLDAADVSVDAPASTSKSAK